MGMDDVKQGIESHTFVDKIDHEQDPPRLVERVEFFRDGTIAVLTRDQVPPDEVALAEAEALRPRPPIE